MPQEHICHSFPVLSGLLKHSQLHILKQDRTLRQQTLYRTLNMNDKCTRKKFSVRQNSCQFNLNPFLLI